MKFLRSVIFQYAFSDPNFKRNIFWPQYILTRLSNPIRTNEKQNHHTFTHSLTHKHTHTHTHSPFGLICAENLIRKNVIDSKPIQKTNLQPNSYNSQHKHQYIIIVIWNWLFHLYCSDFFDWLILFPNATILLI